MIIVTPFCLFMAFIFAVMDVSYLRSYIRVRKWKKQCTCETTGKVVAIGYYHALVKSAGSSQNHRSKIPYPIYQYFVNGNEYILRLSSKSNSIRGHSIGAESRIFYNPLSPEISYAKGFDRSLSFIIGFFIATVYCLLFPKLMYILVGFMDKTFG